MKDIERLSIDYIMKMRYACLCERGVRVGEELNWKRAKWIYGRKSTPERTRTSMASDWVVFLVDFSGGRGLGWERSE